MKNPVIRTVGVLFLLFSAGIVWAQDTPQLINIPLSRPGEPVTLDISILSAHIEVIGEDREDAEFEVSVTKGKRKIITPSGPKDITGGGYSLEVDEQDNHISLSTGWRANQVRVLARIPRRADLELQTTNDGVIIVRDIVGNFQLQNTNGPITATNISGSVIAESVNEDIVLKFSEISDSQTMALASVNGDLNVGLPGNAKAELHIDTSRGEILSDFEVEVMPSKPIIERRENRGGIEVKMENVIVANINGGGTVIKLKTLNGNIQINKN